MLWADADRITFRKLLKCLYVLLPGIEGGGDKGDPHLYSRNEEENRDNIQIL